MSAGAAGGEGRAPVRLDASPQDAGRGLGQLVVAVLEIVRQLLERQALRRVEAGSLGPEEVERLGQALLGLEERFAELRELFGVHERDLRLPVGVEGLLADGDGTGTPSRKGGTP